MELDGLPSTVMPPTAVTFDLFSGCVGFNVPLEAFKEPTSKGRKGQEREGEGKE